MLHPPVLALGVGCERGAAPAALRALVDDTLARHGLARGAIALVASLDLKSDEEAVLALAADLDVPARFFTAPELLAETKRLQDPVGHRVPRRRLLWRRRGRGAGGGRKRIHRSSSPSTSAAARRAPSRAPRGRSMPRRIGKARGRLAVIGIGPGDAASRTGAADAALAAASDVVGYRLYLDLLGGALAGKIRHDGALGEEEARVRLALDLAAAGKSVALVSSGDAGIYALATLVFELLDREDRADWRRVALSVVPGISAMQAAAAKLGAPLGHDFCAISLSDLLTPWDAIARRLKAAADGDFVIALYNPRSARRSDHLARARDILLASRAPDTPVALARNLDRDGETIAVTTLGALDPDQVDMLTLVLIGSSATRRIGDARAALYAARLRAKAAAMTVHFIGAGPGAPDLITVRGLRLIEACPVCLYAGSLVPEAVIRAAPEGARIIDTASLNLDEIIAEMEAAHAAGKDVARVHSGDISLYGAIAEQMRRLDALGIPYDLTPGVPAFAAAAAALGTELTLPDIAQSVILTRTAVRASAMPEHEDLATLAQSRATLVLHLSINNLAAVVRILAPIYGEECPVAVVYRASWPDEQILRGTTGDHSRAGESGEIHPHRAHHRRPRAREERFSR